MPLRLNTPSLAMGMKGGGTPTVAPKERRGVCFGGMKPLEGRIPRLKRSGGRGGFMTVVIIVGFIVFFSLHAVSLRLLSRPATVYRVFFTLVGSWAGGTMVAWFLVHDVLSLVLLTLVIVCYLLGVFVIVDSSIHVRILLLIAGRQNGLTKQELLARYNSKIIVDRRLARLLDAGELRGQHGTYRLVKRMSLLLVRERVSRIVEWLFP